MARDFSKNTSNYINFGVNTVGLLLDTAAKVSVHLLINPDSYTSGASDNRVVSVLTSGSNNAIRGLINGAGANKVFVMGARSVSSDTLQVATGTVDVTIGSWHSVGAVMDYAADNIKTYVDGAQDANASVSFTNNAYTNSHTTSDGDNVGANFAPPGTTAAQFDGKIAEVAFWTDDIGLAGFQQLNKGLSALQVRPDALVFYMPLFGNASPEIDFVSGKSGAITGTVGKIDHPRMIYPSDM